MAYHCLDLKIISIEISVMEVIVFDFTFLSLRDSTERNIPFEHAVMMAELIKHFRPKLVEMHNYSAANSSTKKKYNWATLRSKCLSFSERVAICRKRNLSSPTAEKVFPKLKISISDADVSRIVMSKPGAIEDLLLQVKSSVREHTYTPTHTLTQFIVFFFFYRLTRDGER